MTLDNTTTTTPASEEATTQDHKVKKTKKSSKKVTTLKKPVRIETPEMKFLKSVCRRAGTGSPSDSSTFFEIIREMEMKNVPVEMCAIFCEPTSYAETDNDPAIRNLAKRLTVPNILNPFAELSAKHVDTLGVQLERDGKMHMPIMAAIIKDVPEHLSNLIPAGSVQIWSGRHRLAYVGIKSSPKFKVPMLLGTFSYADAQKMADDANQARLQDGLEKSVLNAKHVILRHDTVEGQFAELNKIGTIMDWALTHSLVLPVNVLEKIVVRVIRDGRGTDEYGLTYPEIKSIIKPIFSVVKNEMGNNFKNLEMARPAINAIMKSLEAFFNQFNSLIADLGCGTLISTYSAPLIGEVIAADMKYALVNRMHLEPTVYGEKAAHVMNNFLRYGDNYKVIRGMRGNVLKNAFLLYCQENSVPMLSVVAVA